MFGKHNRHTVFILFSITALAIPSRPRKRTVKISVLWNDNPDALVVNVAIASGTFPTAAVAIVSQIGIFRHFDCRARLIILFVTAVAYPTLSIGSCMGVDGDFTRPDRNIR